MTAQSMGFALPGHPPTDNATRRLHWAQKGHEVALWRKWAWSAATEQMLQAPTSADGDDGFPWTEVHVHLTFTFAKYARQGLDAYVGASKPNIDGLVDAGVVTDDGFRIVSALTADARIGEPQTLVEVRRPR